MPLSEELRELREVFRDEVRDLAETLERALAALTHDDEAQRRTVVADIYRVVHSVKGAARAVDVPSLERLMHVAEARIGPARTGSLDAASEVERIGSILLDALHAALPMLDRLEEVDPSIAAAALARIESESGVAQRAESRSVERVAEPVRNESVRVGAHRLDEVVRNAEEILSLSARIDARARADVLENALRDLHQDLSRVRSELRTTRDLTVVTAMLDRSVNHAHTAALRARDVRLRATAETAALRLAAKQVVERGRTLRLSKLSALTPALERVADDAARGVSKRVTTTIAFDEVEVDRRVVEGLRDPLLHLVRNAVDHGIADAGTLTLKATVRGRDVEISIADDGRGFDREALRAAAVRAGHAPAEGADFADLAFLPGVSTRERATELSGRGMGLDIVRKRVSELHGRIELKSSPAGTTFVVTVPLDLSVLHVVLVRVRDLEVGIVTTSIERLLRLRAEHIVVLDGRTYLDLGGTPVPLADLAEVLGVMSRPAPPAESLIPCVLLAVGERRVAVRVDSMIGEREIVAQPLGKRVARAPFVSSAAVIGDGEVALVLDTADLVRAAKPAQPAASGPSARRRRILVVDDSVTTRQLERSILESGGFEVVLATDGQHGWETLSSAPDGFDLVVSDIEMPRLDGFALTARIRATPSTSALPVVLVTALSTDDDRRRALELGASAYIVKSSFDQQELLETVEALL